MLRWPIQKERNAAALLTFVLSFRTKHEAKTGVITTNSSDLISRPVRCSSSSSSQQLLPSFRRPKPGGDLLSRAGMMSRRAILRILVFLLCLPCFLSPLAAAIWLNLPSSGSKCVSEEIRANVIVLANYIVVQEDRGLPLPTISAKVTSPYGNNLHLNENVTSSQFAFTTSESGNYLACFWVDGLHKGIGASVNLDWKIGIAAKDWLTVARKEKIEGVELELRKLEAAVETIHENLLYLRTREAVMMAMNESTKSRLAWYGAAALGVCIGVSLFQLWHLKCFFQKKKLI